MGRTEPSTQRMILALGVAGLLTFFLPIVRVTPSALGTTDWSAYAVTMASLSHGSRSALGLYDAFEYWGPYALFAIPLLLLWLPHWHNMFFAVTAANLYCVGKWDFDEIVFFSLDKHWPADGAFERLPIYYGFAVVLALTLYLTWLDHRLVSRAGLAFH